MAKKAWNMNNSQSLDLLEFATPIPSQASPTTSHLPPLPEQSDENLECSPTPCTKSPISKEDPCTSKPKSKAYIPQWDYDEKLTEISILLTDLDKDEVHYSDI
jgi:hypothetical protein